MILTPKVNLINMDTYSFYMPKCLALNRYITNKNVPYFTSTLN